MHVINSGVVPACCVVAISVFDPAASQSFELVQGQLAGRYFSFGDLFANVTETAIGGLWLAVERYVQYRRIPKPA